MVLIFSSNSPATISSGRRSAAGSWRPYVCNQVERACFRSSVRGIVRGRFAGSFIYDSRDSKYDLHQLVCFRYTPESVTIVIQTVYASSYCSWVFVGRIFLFSTTFPNIEDTRETPVPDRSRVHIARVIVRRQSGPSYLWRSRRRAVTWRGRLFFR
jgi:hypothetical protein